MSWTDLSASFGTGSLLTSTQMQGLRDNVSAIFLANSGAPTFVSSAFTERSVNSSHLKSVIAQRLVTNGDSHTHPYRLTTSSFVPGAFSSAKCNMSSTIIDQGWGILSVTQKGFFVAIGSADVPFTGTKEISLQIYLDGTWYTAYQCYSDPAPQQNAGINGVTGFSDTSNMRISAHNSCYVTIYRIGGPAVL